MFFLDGGYCPYLSPSVLVWFWECPNSSPTQRDKGIAMLTVVRNADQSDNDNGRREYRAGISASFIERGHPGYVSIAFKTNPDGYRKQFYRVKIAPSDFETVAREMLKADPKSAIRAFGAAMRDFQTEP